MIKFHDLKVGDIVYASYEGKRSEGEVVELNRDDKQVCVDTGVQQFWFSPEDLSALPLTEKQLLDYNFERHLNGDGAVKYMKGAFRIQIPKPGHFSDMEIWYREDRRHLREAIPFHELQNHYLQMTKIHLTKD
jgi:hypothetical protein